MAELWDRASNDQFDKTLGLRSFVYTVPLWPRTAAKGHAPAPRDIYGRSKWQAEQALAQIAGATGLSYTVLRSPLVYGPGVGGNFASLIRLCDSPWPLPLGATDLAHASYSGKSA